MPPALLASPALVSSNALWWSAVGVLGLLAGATVLVIAIVWRG